MKKVIKWAGIAALVVAGSLLVLAYGRTMNKTDIEFLVHINEELVLQSVFGESPTFAIWLEDPGTGDIHTVYVTRRLATGDWEGKSDVPVALPMWTEINKVQVLRKSKKAEAVHEDLAFSGATPLPGYFRSRVRISPGSKWICWMEMNLAGDFNETYPRFDAETRIEDEYGTGQPSILYRAEIEAEMDQIAIPELSGMCLYREGSPASIEALKGITTATGVFDEISISVHRPKPRILKKAYIEIQ